MIEVTTERATNFIDCAFPSVSIVMEPKNEEVLFLSLLLKDKKRRRARKYHVHSIRSARVRGLFCILYDDL